MAGGWVTPNPKYIYIYIYIYMCVCVCVYMCIGLTRARQEGSRFAVHPELAFTPLCI